MFVRSERSRYEKAYRHSADRCFVFSGGTFLRTLAGSAAGSIETENAGAGRAAEAAQRFSDYQESVEDADYWGGVAAFHVFQEAYAGWAADPTDRSVCSEVYGSLLQLPERGKEHLPELIGAMELLSQNAGDKAGQAKLLELRNALKYE